MLLTVNAVIGISISLTTTSVTAKVSATSINLGLFGVRIIALQESVRVQDSAVKYADKAQASSMPNTSICIDTATAKNCENR
ncbi:hypothetical protein GCM10007377_13430 [Galliscardovia ingluviei]|uniref:Uncharacterized protein n=1 Tax=Galliscardovia ingluviei TaxID=1769422 RepID=A0A8J3ALG7_9BIFI|nr:hypothetical protein GCM10007377_13430 [Galliscardovia ingluviei]